jgi:hypothetical protein
MLNRWDPWYSSSDPPPREYGPTETYELAEEFLRGLDVEDWGCGLGKFRDFHSGGYVGVDGTLSDYCDEHADLTEFTSITPGLLLRHVLEHNVEWRKILDNALASYTHRLVIVLFTSLQDETRTLQEDVGGLGVPDIGFALSDLLNPIMTDGVETTFQTIRSEAGYGTETLIYCERV